ncbi:hypothetical protein [Pseudomonas kurunegalensis]|uniref:hypothetical protein n=1 Tax=Pseudomonas kurunegalensis TaxID=485880 RepID=UPI0040266306
MSTSAVYNTKRKAFMLRAGDLVVIRPEAKGASATPVVIKLTVCKDQNSLGWSKWQFSVIVGVPPFMLFTPHPEDMVEVCVPTIDVDRSRCPQLPLVYRPFHVYVEEAEGSNVYSIYKFSRRSLASQVMKCARRFGLMSFVITDLHSDNAA